VKHLAALLLLTACAQVPPQVAIPPARYKLPANAILKTMSPDEVHQQCRNPEALMCAKGAFIFAPFPWLYPDDAFAVALWHELAHVLGWAATHPD
jgi:hypothetical protein